MSYDQIQEREGIPLGSIGPTRARCLEELRQRLDTSDDVSNDTRSGTTRYKEGVDRRSAMGDRLRPDQSKKGSAK